MKNVVLAPGSITVVRSSDAAWLLGENYYASPGSKLAILPDSATAQDIISAINAFNAPAPLPPTA